MKQAEAPAAKDANVGTELHFGSLDGLRALAVIAVLWHHAGGRSDWLHASHRGYLGVDLFFVISGFLITTLLLREQERCGRIHLRAFYGRRALRLMPLYYAVLGLVALLFSAVWPEAPSAQAYFEDLPYYASYTSNWIVSWTFMALTWSLALEEQFYLVWPAVLRFAPAAAKGLLLLACGGSLFAHAGLMDRPLAWLLGSQWGLHPMVLSTLLPLGLGCALGLWLARQGSRAQPPKWLAPAALGALVLVVSLPADWDLHLVVGLAQGCMALLVLGCAFREDHGLAWLLRGRALAYLGRISYGLYLLHMLALQLVFELEFRGWVTSGIARFACTLALSVLLAALSFRFLERPFLDLRARLRPEPKPAVRRPPGID